MLIGKCYWKDVILPSILQSIEVMNFTKKEINSLQKIENGVYAPWVRAVSACGGQRTLGTPALCQADEDSMALASMKVGRDGRAPRPLRYSSLRSMRNFPSSPQAAPAAVAVKCFICKPKRK